MARQQIYDFAAYDDAGNLYVSGESDEETLQVLSRLRARANGLRQLKIAGATIHEAGTALWNDGKLILGDQACNGGTNRVCTSRRSRAVPRR